MKTWLAILLVSSIAHAASIVEFSGTEAKVAGVKVLSDAKAKLPAGEVPLKLSGAGIRTKTKLLLTFNVYVASSYVTDVQALRRAATPVEGVRQQNVKVLKLDMLRALSAAEIRQSFEEALELNGVNIDAAEIQDIFAQWKSAVKTGDSITMIGFEEAKEDKIVIEVGGKTINSKGKDISFDFWKIWFGKGDDGITSLQKLLVGKE